MRSQVRALLLSAPADPLLAAPADVLSALSDAVPDPARRFPLAPGALSGSLGPVLRGGFTAGRWARACGADLLHGHGLRLAPLFAAASVAARLPLVITLHNLVPRPDALSPAALLALRIAFFRARRVIAVSEAVAASARAAGIFVPSAPHRRRASQMLVVVPNGVDATRFAFAAQQRQRTRKPSPEGSGPVALCVARLSPEKDVGGFLEAAALVAGRLATARFWIAGDGPLLPTLRHQVRQLGLEGRADLLGRRDDIPALLAAADLLCLPSREEGLGLAALEAMAAGLPVVATRVGGLAEVVEDGKTGLLVPPGDRAALANALRELLSDAPRSLAMGKAGRARVEAHYTQEAMIAATQAVYAEAAR
jgi:glycosyltransferase involved in cell wall biosynthesis